LDESLRQLKDSESLVEIFGKRFVTAYNAVKETEFTSFLRVISSWEREYLLLNV
jgi:glutamine synthetase